MSTSKLHPVRVCVCARVWCCSKTLYPMQAVVLARDMPSWVCRVLKRYRTRM